MTTCYIKISVGYFELKLHIYTLGTSKAYFTSCENGIIPALRYDFKSYRVFITSIH